MGYIYLRYFSSVQFNEHIIRTPNDTKKAYYYDNGQHLIAYAILLKNTRANILSLFSVLKLFVWIPFETELEINLENVWNRLKYRCKLHNNTNEVTGHFYCIVLHFYCILNIQIVFEIHSAIIFNCTYSPKYSLNS